jgi:hypothetical protein
LNSLKGFSVINPPRQSTMPGNNLRRAAYAFITLATVFASSASHASIVTVTLDLSALPTGAFSSALTVNGFTLTPLLGGASTPQIANNAGRYSLQSTGNVFAGGADTYLTMNNGGAYSLLSVEIAALIDSNADYAIGIANDGGGITFGPSFSRPVPRAWTLEDLTGVAGLANTHSIDLDVVSNPGNFAISAITVAYSVTNVPEPVTIGLFGVALAGLATVRRQRANRTR